MSVVFSCFVFSCCRRSNVALFGETFQGRPCEAMLDSCLCRGVADRQGEQKRPAIPGDLGPKRASSGKCLLYFELGLFGGSNLPSHIGEAMSAIG